MRATSVVRRRALGAVAAAAIALTLTMTLTGCGAAANGEVAVDGGNTAAPGATSMTEHSSPSPEADQPSATASKSASPRATLPSGDPGPNAPGTDDPNGDLGGQSSQPKHAAKTRVPKTAVLDAETVASVAGGSWTSSAAPADSCASPHPAKAVATRSSLLTDATGATPSRIVETVATHRGVNAAVAAVRAFEHRLIACHATSAPDPRIGDASVQLTLVGADGTTTVVTAAAVDGVTFVLSGSGPVTGVDQWSALTDIALGSTCVAAVEGCH